MAAYPKHCLDFDLRVGDGCAGDPATDEAAAKEIQAGRRSMKGSSSALSSTSEMAMAARKTKQPIPPRPLLSMLAGGQWRDDSLP